MFVINSYYVLLFLLKICISLFVGLVVYFGVIKYLEYDFEFVIYVEIYSIFEEIV